ncbi:outer membrane protein assembly factor BamE [Alphaproteobacteria bacterium]|nr:outer membrane protein assembly factor BamE [Alphaproteobacteria bacterium]
MSVTRQVRAFVLFLMLSLSALLLGGCTAQVDVRGSAPSDEDLATVRRGIDTKKDIQERFGLPIITSAADPNVWYYVKQDLRPLPLSPPNVIGQRIVVIQFDPDELVLDMTVQNGLVGDTDFRPDPDSSKIYGPDRSAAQEFFRNIFGSVGFKQ